MVATTTSADELKARKKADAARRKNAAAQKKKAAAKAKRERAAGKTRKKTKARKKASGAATAAKKAASKAAKPWKPKPGDKVIGLVAVIENWRGEIRAVDHTGITVIWKTDAEGGSRDGCAPGRWIKPEWLALDVKA